ncbi:hypothetical protein [Gordonia aichiensis]
MSSSTEPAILPTQTARGRLGMAGHFRETDPAKFAGVQRDYRATKIRDAIQEAVETAPPLTAAQVDALSALLNSARAEAK